MEQLTFNFQEKQTKISLVTQPKKSKICGQCCTAMIAGITKEEAIKIYGHASSTHLGETIDILERLGISTSGIIKVDNRRRWQLPQKAIVRIKYGTRRMGHVVVLDNGKFYDPLGHIFNSKQELLDHYTQRGAKTLVSHYLEIHDHENDQLLKVGGM